MGDSRDLRPATLASHLGRDPQRFLGAVNTPVFRASTILFPTVADLEQSARGEYEGLSYGLHGVPTVTDLQSAVAAIEGAHAAFAVPSGLTATTLPLLALLNPAITCWSPIPSTARPAASATSTSRASVSK